jgi:hypothetical protein
METIYIVLLTPEHAPLDAPKLARLCEYHYLQAASCLMIRRVVSVGTEGECNFCS